MMIDGQDMEPQEATVKVQVVYYLSRAGQLQQPHLIDVTISPHSNGLYLRDVKQKLTAIRGKGVADSFSWSCKRNYKDNFIWQDLSDDDKILPLGDGEFVLKGSGLYAGYRAPGKGEFLDGQIDPESTSLSPKQDSVKGYNHIDQKKVDFGAVKRSLDPQMERLQDQSDLAAALSLSLQLMSNPHAHLKRFSKDKSMDLNQQVMNSLSQAKSGPPEECTIDRYDMSSNETFLSEESCTRNTFRESTAIARECHQSTSSSTRTDLYCDLPVAKQCETKSERPISADDAPKISNINSVALGRHEKPDELPPIKTKFKASVAQELGDNTAFMLSPRRIMAVLSSAPEKKLGKILHSSSLRSSTLSNSASSHAAAVEPMSAMRLSNKATCLSQLRFCSQLSPHATDSRPDSPVRPANNLSMLVQPSTTPQLPSTTARSAQSGPYWTRWKPGRRSRSSEPKVVAEEPSTPSQQADFASPADRTSTTVRRALNASFEFDMATDGNSGSGPGTPQLPHSLPNNTSNESSNLSPSKPRKLITISSDRIDTSVSAGSHLGLNMTSETSNAEAMAPISVKEVITERLPVQQSAPAVGEKYTGGTSVKEIILPKTPKHLKADGGQSFKMDNASLSPRFSRSESVPGAGVQVSAALPESPESPLKQNPPCSPIRTLNSPQARTNNLAARPVTSPGSFNKRTEDGRARARGLVKEITSKDSKFMKDLAKEVERSKVTSSGTMRSIASSKRTSGIKNATTTMGAKAVMLSGANRSPPRISSLLWEEPPHTPKKNGNIINRDERPLTAGRSNLDWERTLHEEASVSLPPADFGQILQECGLCGRTFKPDSLKVHMRGCHGVRRSPDSEIPTIYGANATSMRVRQ